MSVEVKLPELGENIEGAQVLTVLVSPGDTVSRDQPIIELETDKATAEVPSDAEGVVQEIKVQAGDEIQVGQTILVLEAAGAGGGEPKKTKAETESAPAGAKTAEPEPAAKPAEPEPEATPPPEKRAATPAEPEPEPAAAGPAPAVPSAPELRLVDEGRPPRASTAPVPAAPRIRRLARELGIDIHQVAGTGPAGRISEADVKNHAKRIITGSAAPAPAGAPAPGAAPPLPDFSRWGETERKPASKIRRVTAEVMATAWSVVPHVTQHDRADITDLESWRKEYTRKNPEPKITVTAIVVKAAAAALRRFPVFNASYDAAAAEIVYKKYVNVGVAVDTDRGLLVPTVFDADTKGVKQIAADITELAAKARDRKISVDELSGANLNISNLGGLGTTAFSPIVAWPQVAVIGIGRGRVEAVHADGSFVPRLILPLSVSYDHRIIDGADAARFLRWIAEVLEQPLTLVLEGGA